MEIWGAGILVAKRKDSVFIGRLISNGFWCYIAVCILVFIIDYKRYFSSWDELSHWGKMVKEMLRLDKFYSEACSDLLVHKDYPPLAGIFEMFICRLQAGYSDAGVTMGLHFMEFTLIAPIVVENYQSIGGKRKEKVINSMMLLIIISLLIIGFEKITFSTTHIDILTPVIYVYGISVIFDENLVHSKFGYIGLLMTVISLVLTKQIGIAFVLLIWLFYTIWICFNEKQKFNQNTIQMNILKSCGLLVFPFVNYIMWSRYIKALGISGQFNFYRINFKQIISIILGGGSDLQHSTYKNYLKALLSTELFTGTFKLTYFAAFIFSICLLVAFSVFFKEKFTRENWIKITCLFVCGTAGYAFTMFILYMFCFSVEEMNNLAGFTRYLGSYVLSEYLILFIIFNLLISKTYFQIKWKIMSLALAISIVLMDYTSFLYLSPQIYKGEPNYSYREKAERIQNVTEPSDSIFLVSSSNCQIMYYLNYYLDDRDMDARYLYKDVSKYDIHDSDHWKDIIDCIMEDDYVYVYDTSDSANQVLGKYTEDGFLVNHSLYQVLCIEGEIQLKKCDF